MGWDWLLDIAARFGLPFALVLTALLTGRSGMWVWGREIAEMRQDRDYYRDIAYEALNRAEKAQTTAEQATNLAEQRGPRRRP